MYAGLAISDKPALLDAKARGVRTCLISLNPLLKVDTDIALAQIAEMESAEKPCPYCSTDAFSPRRVGLYGSDGFNPYHIYLSGGGSIRDGEQFDYCPKCARPINRGKREEST